jgi:YVTN family beta-propeller protein
MKNPMDVHHPVHHGKHRRRRRHRRILVVGLSFLVLTGGIVAALAWNGGPASSNAEQGVGPAASAATEHVEHTRPQQTASSSAPPPQSAATPGTGSVVAVGKAPHDMAVSPDGSFAYIADPGVGGVIRFDTAGSRETATIPVPEAPPQMVTFSPDGSRAFVTAFDEDFTVNYLAILDTRSDTAIAVVPVGRGPYAAATTLDGRLLLLPYYDEDHLDVLDTNSGALVVRIPLPPCPHWVAFSHDGRFAYITNHFSDVVTVLDLQTYSAVTSIPVGDGPHSLEVSPDGTRVAVVNYISGDVSIIDPTTNAVVGTVPSVGAGPQDVTYARTTGTSTRPMWTTARWRSSMRAAAPKPRGSPPAAARRASR